MAPPAEQELTPQEEAAAARALLAKGELTPAIQHIGRALATDPANAAWRVLLDQIIAKAGDALKLFPPGESGKGTPPETAAIRAYVFAHLGRIADAINLLIRVAAARPTVPYLEWAGEWIERDPSAAAKVDRKALQAALHTILPTFRGVIVKDPAKRRTIEGLRRFLDHVASDLNADPPIAAARITAMRKLGDLNRALTQAGRMYKSKPNYYIAAAISGIYQALKDDENWMKWAQRALKHDPKNVPSRVDLGDAYFDRKQYAEAVRWYQEAVDLQKDHPWALPSMYASRLHAGERGDWLALLMRYVEDNPKNEHAREVLQPLLPTDPHYITDLPTPDEPTIAKLRDLERQAVEDVSQIPALVRVSIPYMGTPSARVALVLGLEAARLTVKLQFDIGEIQKPDPRLPRREVEHRAWDYPDKRILFKKLSGTDPEPAGPNPSPWFGRRVAELADKAYDRPAWSKEAYRIALEVGGKRVEDILGTLSRPPKPPKDVDAADWVYRIQVATALVLANLDRNQPWESSLRKEVLFDLALGPLDWTVNAAVIALTQLAEEEPESVEDIKALFFEELLKTRPKPGPVCYLHPLVCCAQQLPGLSAEERATLIDWQLDLEKE